MSSFNPAPCPHWKQNHAVSRNPLARAPMQWRRVGGAPAPPETAGASPDRLLRWQAGGTGGSTGAPLRGLAGEWEAPQPLLGALQPLPSQCDQLWGMPPPPTSWQDCPPRLLGGHMPPRLRWHQSPISPCAPLYLSGVSGAQFPTTFRSCRGLTQTLHHQVTFSQIAVYNSPLFHSPVRETESHRDPVQDATL